MVKKKEKKESKAIVKAQDNSPASVIQYAIASGASIEKLEKLLALQERYDANEARKAYHVAMAEVHKKMPSVAKTALNPQTRSKYAKLENIIESAKWIIKAKEAIAKAEGRG